MDEVFKALADPGRRKMLDIIKNKPGITVNELSEYFEYSRYGVMKHLKILEKANLFTFVREGKFKKLYLNVMPIQFIYDRWISKYSAIWAKNLSFLKHKLEEESQMAEQELKHVFVTYIKTTKEKLWEALTDPGLTKHYFYGTELKGEIKVGSKIEYHGLDKEGNPNIPVEGEILEVVPYKKLVHSFRFPISEDKTSRTVYKIEEQEDYVKLTLTHDQFESETQTYKSVSEGWPFILSGLKTFLETNKPLA
ncbi:ArsR/SmtB family transcription factor [Bacteroidota bacterium]